MPKSMFKAMFHNPFAREDYSLVDLCLFGKDAATRSVREFVPEATEVRTALHRCVQESAEVRIALGEQVSATGDVDAFILNLRSTMEGCVDGISHFLGGRQSKGFLAFFPDGRTEFTHLAKKDADETMRRISLAVDRYGAQLDDRIKATLQRLEADWTAVRGEQLEKKSEVGTNRSERLTAREQLVLALWKLSATVLLRYFNQPDKCLEFFREHLLKGEGVGQPKAEDGQPG
ncbi:hypothetical protein [Flaviaesturariibacter aridisoli]|uniref:Uncharacterized protein n=1 Tax=Flaviaesturariibacter aridisoli TaxID=2545761 RepID=A0A4R4DVU0_9BACT|nr:hypothetical protein [Flaviaesturariibacter aridisoli]TCZ67888.1 hypothetical protein E0486_15095 [Flaviaesturariibacter aridisoli]